LLLGFEPVGTKEFEAALSLFLGETLLVTLEEGEDIVENDGLEVDLVLVVEILGF
jgi:hypothetical protein